MKKRCIITILHSESRRNLHALLFEKEGQPTILILMPGVSLSRMPSIFVNVLLENCNSCYLGYHVMQEKSCFSAKWWECKCVYHRKHPHTVVMRVCSRIWKKKNCTSPPSCRHIINMFLKRQDLVLYKVFMSKVSWFLYYFDDVHPHIIFHAVLVFMISHKFLIRCL